ncbi:MAG: zinc-ribbon domain-containing protein, partial [Lachnospiraceae bacterium]|nr:zinc-ribbon domain-containing protein [Lachnospiraceae bacterium]
MFCPNCGMQLPDTAQFCPNCGTRLAAPPAQGAPQAAPSDRPPQQFPQGAPGQMQKMQRPAGTPKAPV